MRVKLPKRHIKQISLNLKQEIKKSYSLCFCIDLSPGIRVRYFRNLLSVKTIYIHAVVVNTEFTGIL